MELFHQAEVDNSLLESLLVDESEKRCFDLGQASFLSKLTFSWINPFLKLGNPKPLNLDDIPSLGYEDEAFPSYKKFTDEWRNVLETEKNAKDLTNLVIWAMTRVYWKNMVIAGSCTFLRTTAVVVTTPLLFFAFVNYSSLEQKNLKKGIFLMGLLVVLKIIESLSYRHFSFYSRRIGMRMRSALMMAFYEKQLKLSSFGRQSHSTGEIVNYIAVDAYRMENFPMWFHVGWTSVGMGVLPGLVPFVICGLLNVPLAKLLQKFQKEFVVAQDKRLRSLSEVLDNMKIIKLQSWEENFKNMIESYRRSELKWLSTNQYMMSLAVKSKTRDVAKCEAVDGRVLQSWRHFNVRGKSATPLSNDVLMTEFTTAIQEVFMSAQNSIVLKTVRQTPLSTLLARRLLYAAGIAGVVLNIGSGYGIVAATTLFHHKDVNQSVELAYFVRFFNQGLCFSSLERDILLSAVSNVDICSPRSRPPP